MTSIFKVIPQRNQDEILTRNITNDMLVKATNGVDNFLIFKFSECGKWFAYTYVGGLRYALPSGEQKLKALLEKLGAEAYEAIKL